MVFNSNNYYDPGDTNSDLNCHNHNLCLIYQFLMHKQENRLVLSPKFVLMMDYCFLTTVYLLAKHRTLGRTDNLQTS